MPGPSFRNRRFRFEVTLDGFRRGFQDFDEVLGTSLDTLAGPIAFEVQYRRFWDVVRCVWEAMYERIGSIRQKGRFCR